MKCCWCLRLRAGRGRRHLLDYSKGLKSFSYALAWFEQLIHHEAVTSLPSAVRNFTNPGRAVKSGKHSVICHRQIRAIAEKRTGLVHVTDWKRRKPRCLPIAAVGQGFLAKQPYQVRLARMQVGSRYYYRGVLPVDMQESASNSINHYLAPRTEPPSRIAEHGRIPESHGKEQGECK